MKIICSHKDQCDIETCPHAVPHDGCGHTCQRMAGARCVMNVAGLPEYKETGTIAVMVWRREKAA